MKRMQQKLNSQNGLSLIFALLIMLVVTTVSTTIVIASVTAVKRTNQAKDFRQRSLALESAALMFQEKIRSNDEQLEALLAAPLKEYRLYDGEKEVTGGPFFVTSNIEEFPTVSVFFTIQKTDHEYASFSEEENADGYQVVFRFQTEDDENYKDTLRLYCRIAETDSSDGEVSYTWTKAGFRDS